MWVDIWLIYGYYMVNDGFFYYLVGGLNLPLWKNDGLRQLGVLFPIYGKIKFMFQTTKQISIPFTLWLFNIAMENGPFIDVMWWFTFEKWWFSIATLNNQRVYSINISCHIIFSKSKLLSQPSILQSFIIPLIFHLISSNLT